MNDSDPPDAVTVRFRVEAIRIQIGVAMATNMLSDARSFGREDVFAGVLEAVSERDKQLQAALIKNGTWSYMTIGEKHFIATPADQRTLQMVINASWMMESCECMLWVLGLIDEISQYDTQANPEKLKSVVTGKTSEFRNARLIDRPLIERAREVAELWHWRCRTRQLQDSGRDVKFPDGMTFEDVISITANAAFEKGDIHAPIDGDFPAFGRAFRDLTPEQYSLANSIAMERHKAFNWLCGYAPQNQWDKTPTDT